MRWLLILLVIVVAVVIVQNQRHHCHWFQSGWVQLSHGQGSGGPDACV